MADAIPKIGEYLISKGKITHAELERALSQQSEWKRDNVRNSELGNVLLINNRITEDDLCSAIHDYVKAYPASNFAKGLPYISTNAITIQDDLLDLIRDSFSIVLQYKTLPYYYNKEAGEIRYITISDEKDSELFHTKFSQKGNIIVHVPKLYKTFEKPFVDLLQRLADHFGMNVQGEEFSIYELKLNDKILNMFRDAVKCKASDIFIVPFKDRVRVKFKSDTVGHIYTEDFTPITPKENDNNSNVARIILNLCNLPNTELTNGAVDGAIDSLFGPFDRSWSARVNIVKTVMGFKIVMRLIPNEQDILTLEQLGMPPNIRNYVKENSQKEAGLVLITGHMGSGKNTTIYASLLEIDTVVREVSTVEDPVERRLDKYGISQTQIGGALTFPKVAGGMVRQAIDVVFIGEIRDAETIKLAVDAAGAGMLLFSTLHIDRIAQVWQRVHALDDTILPRFIPVLEGIMTQKLVRKICPHCRKEITFNELQDDDMAYMNRSKFYTTPDSNNQRHRTSYKGRYFEGVGCKECKHTGYKGVTVVTEMLPITPKLKNKLSTFNSFSELEYFTDEYLEDNKLSFKYQGITLLDSGITTVEELRRKNVLDFDINE